MFMDFSVQMVLAKARPSEFLLSLVKADSGTISVFGLPHDTSRSIVLPRVGALVERPDFYEHLTAERNLAILSRYSRKKSSKDEINRTLALVGLEERGADMVRSFSEGMKQRLGIAQSNSAHARAVDT